jgi:hypothetical protein
MPQSKLQTLCEIEGFDDEIALFEAFVTDSVCPGICMTPGCNYTTQVEPDCSDGWCEECQKNTIKSAMILGEII